MKSPGRRQRPSYGYLFSKKLLGVALNYRLCPDLRLCKFFRLTDGYFLRLQISYDLLEAKRAIADKITKIKPYVPEGTISHLPSSRF